MKKLIIILLLVIPFNLIYAENYQLTNDSVLKQINETNLQLVKNTTLNHADNIVKLQESSQESINLLNRTNNNIVKLQESSQESINLLNQTNSHLTDLIRSEKDTANSKTLLDPAEFQIISLVTIVSSLIGVSLGLLVDRIRNWSIEIGRINKTRNLLRDDILRIYNNLNTILLDIEKLNSMLNTENTLEDLMLLTGGVVEENITRILVNTKILSWDMIVNNGYLIKLKTNEIKELQSLQNYLEDMQNQLTSHYNLAIDSIGRHVRNTALSTEAARIAIKTDLADITAFFHLTYPKIINRIHRTQNDIDWIAVMPEPKS